MNLTEEEQAKGYLRPLRTEYWHRHCGKVTKMGPSFADTLARNPSIYGTVYCQSCERHLRVEEFTWLDGSVVGS